ncbi:DNA-directed RNA polymerase I, II, and III, subunit 11 [Giardia duodenalis]|uniref:DNA-directed RNA polymerase I, II, and III, subunit 11 n=1 Tax=Giardia intestinalis TaxID=5741 RepID=V6TNN9_GIAIN|nr:DNA-directed RNA polymerase I, II, and III, subunit 11 [Giardia intestinalis]
MEGRNATFVIVNEDHTLGNCIRYCLTCNPAVSFAGYSVPHPAEPKLNLRIQSDTQSATDCLLQAADLMYAIASVLRQRLAEVCGVSPPPSSRTSENRSITQ